MRLDLLNEDPKRAAIAIVWDGDKVLLGLSNNDDNRKGKWCFPGGAIESDETPEKAGERECEEETGITCKAKKKFRHHRAKTYWFVVCQKTGGSLIPNHEFTKLKWFDPEEALELDNLFRDCQDLLGQTKAKLS